MNVLVIGGGGREHALCWKIKKSPLVGRVYCAPGNAGISRDAKTVEIKDSDVESLIKLAVSEEIGLTVVGPELPLSLGIVDRFEERGLRVFGPSKEAAQLEISKSYAKALLKKYKIPTGYFSTFTEFSEALRWVEEVKPPLVVKADGLAAGKGVFICPTLDQARDALDAILNRKLFGDAGDKVVIEEYLEGEEVSFFAFSDGLNVLPLASSQDHKRLLDGDAGPNTGGMGAYSPAPIVTTELFEKIMSEVVIPTVNAMNEEGHPYRGILYVGLMVSNGEPKVLEYNCRFGDPEAQPLLMRMKSDIVPIMCSVADGDLSGVKVEWMDDAAVCVVMASKGYPGDYKKGYPIWGLSDADAIEGVKVFHAGTAFEEGNIVTNGGRVLGVTALGKDIPAAIDSAYRAVREIDCDNLHYRNDIGSKAFKYLADHETHQEAHHETHEAQ